MAMREETHRTPLVCDNGHRYEDDVDWTIHTVEESDDITNQVPNIRVTCRECDATLHVADGWTPY